mmetsp:Transcript_30624/g.47990  ORF Transcript_30624/g.47990 Transcript_30624/m.47990 type:complete len:103 (+) Transcript_30624:69-377(+)
MVDHNSKGCQNSQFEKGVDMEAGNNALQNTGPSSRFACSALVGQNDWTSKITPLLSCCLVLNLNPMLNHCSAKAGQLAPWLGAVVAPLNCLFRLIPSGQLIV